MKKELKDIKQEIKSIKKKGKLYGYVIGVKSNINVLGMHASCASKVLVIGTCNSAKAAVISLLPLLSGLLGSIPLPGTWLTISEFTLAFQSCLLKLPPKAKPTSPAGNV